MTIEEYIVSYLNTELEDVPVSGDAPATKPASFVTVEKTGERIKNYVPRATIAVQSWAPSRASAMALNERVKEKMLFMPEAPTVVSKCSLNSEYNYPHEASKHPRYQAVFEVVYDYNISA